MRDGAPTAVWLRSSSGGVGVGSGVGAEPLAEDGAVGGVEAVVLLAQRGARPAGGQQRWWQQRVRLEVAQHRGGHDEARSEGARVVPVEGAEQRAELAA